MYHVKKIGLFISHLFGRYQQELCQAVMDRAAEYGCRVEVLASVDGENMGSYGDGEESILDIPGVGFFDAVIFASGTYPDKELRLKIAEMLRKKCSCPVLEIGYPPVAFPCLNMDNNTMFGMLTNHFATVHHCRRICYLGSTDHPELSALRQKYYLESLARLGRTPEPSDIVLAAENRESIREALGRLAPEDGCPPDAVVCYCDDMALELLACALERGIRVPEEMAVSGCDNLPLGREISPSLTTITFPTREMGKQAVDLVVHAAAKEGPVAGKIPAGNTLVCAEPEYRNSCGCGNGKGTSFLLDAKLQNRIEGLEKSMISDIHMSARLQTVMELETGMDILEEYVRKLSGIREIYICLYPDWNRIPDEIFPLAEEEESWSDTETMLLSFAMQDGRRLPECSFVRRAMLPEYLYARTDAHFICQPLYFGKKAFGYLALSFEGNHLNYPFSYVSWLHNLNSMLENIRRNRQTSLLLERLEKLELKDGLTGLYNRASFLRLTEKELSQKDSEGTGFILCADIRSLKEINRRFGREEGDFAIRVTGHAVENAAAEGKFCARTGGDSFAIFGRGKAEIRAAALAAGIRRYLNNYNQLRTRRYVIETAIRYAEIPPEEKASAARLLEAAEQGKEI